MRRSEQSGFTLIEAVVAIALLAFVVMHFLGTRTEAMIDAAEARNWRVAREIAEMYLSELRAGARETPPDNGFDFDIPDYPGFRAKFLIGESAISQAEADMASVVDDYAPPGANSSQSDRISWQQERDRLRRARAAGVSYTEYQDQLLAEELEEDQTPSENDFEDVAIVVTFPKVTPDESGAFESSFVLKAKLSTMAIEGLTPEEVERIAAAKGETTGAGGLPPGLGGGAGGEGGTSGGETDR